MVRSSPGVKPSTDFGLGTCAASPTAKRRSIPQRRKAAEKEPKQISPVHFRERLHILIIRFYLGVLAYRGSMVRSNEKLKFPVPESNKSRIAAKIRYWW